MEDEPDCVCTRSVVEGTQLHAAGVDGGCIDPVLPPTSEGSQRAIEFPCVANPSSSPRLNSGRETDVSDESVNKYAPQSTYKSEEYSLPVEGCAEPLDPNGNSLLYSKRLSGQGDGLTHVNGPVKTSDVHFRANSYSVTVRQNPRREVGNPTRTSHPSSERDTLSLSKEPGKPQASAQWEHQQPVEGTWESSLAVCGKLDVRQEEALCTSKEPVPEVPGDSEAGPGAALFSQDEFRCSVEHFNDPSAFDLLQKVGRNKQLRRYSLGNCSLYLEFDPLLADRRHSSTERKAPEEEQSLPTQAPEELIELCSFPSQHPSDTTVLSESVPDEGQEEMFSEEMCLALKLQELLFQARLRKKEQEQCEEQKQARARFDIQKNAICRMYQATKEMARVCEESSKERQRLHADVAQLTKQRDQLEEDIRSVETAFSVFHRRYEQAKDIIRAMKENESLLRKQLEDSHDMLKHRDEMLKTLETKTEEPLHMASEEIENSRKSMDAENIALKAQLKRLELRNSSLERQLEEKTEETAQLMQLYGDLISKVQQN